MFEGLNASMPRAHAKAKKRMPNWCSDCRRTGCEHDIREPAFEAPNAQVQGRALGEAEARSGGGVPCNAQLGAGLGTQRLDMALIASDPLVVLVCDARARVQA